MNKNLIKITATILSALTFSTVAMPSSNAARRGRPPKEITADKKSADNKKPAVPKLDKITEYYNYECDFEFHMADEETDTNYFLRELKSILHESLNASKYANLILKLNEETQKNTLYISKPNKGKPRICVDHNQLVLDKNWQVYSYVFEKKSNIPYREIYISYINYDKQIVIVTRKIPTEKNENITRIETLSSFTNYIKENIDKGFLSDTFYAHIPVNNVENTVRYYNPTYSMYDHLKDFQERNNFKSKYCSDLIPVQTQTQVQAPTQAQALYSFPTLTPTQDSTPMKEEKCTHPSLIISSPCAIYLHDSEIAEKFFDKLNEIKDDIFITEQRNYKLSNEYYNGEQILKVETKDREICKFALNPEIEMNENWYKIIFPLPQSYTLPDTYGKLYVNLKNQIVVVTITNNKGMTQFYGIGSIFGFALKEIIDNCSPLYRFPVTFFYNRSDKIMKGSKYSLCKVGIMAFNSKKIGKFKFVGR